ncbi:MAG: MerR family transcriptional regulator [Vicinamibacterales bacterium]|jgi:MerR family transcriptional regulator/heat shock protein HspR|nr:MerR family transcriptional regulator [Vicinamibacterales bacterium]
MSERTEVYLISMAARELGLHPQTLRKYERVGLVKPSRVIGSMRVYSRAEIDRLRVVKHLVDELGINLAGVQRLLAVADAVRRLQPLACDDALTRLAGRRRLARELEHLAGLLGL